MANPKRPDLWAEHALVAKVIGNASSKQKFVVIAGYVGRSIREDRLRVYDSLEFDSYVEIPQDALVHREDAPVSEPHEESLLWVNASAEITMGARAAEAE